MTHRGPFQPRTFCDSEVPGSGPPARWQGVTEALHRASVRGAVASVLALLGHSCRAGMADA